MSSISCPYCGFTSRLLCSDGSRCKYVCERCKSIFFAD